MGLYSSSEVWSHFHVISLSKEMAFYLCLKTFYNFFKVSFTKYLFVL